MSITAFEAHRPHLRALAYRMLGSRSDAENVVQEAWLRWQGVDHAQVRDALAYLCRTTTRLCLDQIQRARARRERYVGLWLPEPLVDDALWDYCDPDPEAALGQRQQLSLGFLLALQHLRPLERAAFLLHDVFDRGFDEVAQTLGRSSAACRQLANRARKRLQAQGLGPDAPTPPSADDPRTQALLGAFAHALASGDVQALAALLAEDVHLYSDGGGVVCAVPAPLGGRLRVAQALLTFARTWQRTPGGAPALRAALVNGEPGALVWNAQGTLEDVCALRLNANGQVLGVYFQRNPKKLLAVGA